MKIAALRFYNVKRFARRGVAIENIGEGVNVLCAANEHGKSTSFEALHALFFQPHMGSGKDVRRLQPYSGGNPVIEADIVTEQGRFRLAKQFIGGKRASVTDLSNGRLLHQADEAEAFITGLISGGTSGPAGLLWVRQGVTGLEERDRKEEEGERRVRESLLASVQGEVEAMTGGRRMSQILDAVGGELAKIATATLRPKAGEPYAAAIDRANELRQREATLRGEVAALREALDRRSSAQKRLDELTRPEERAALRAAVDATEATFMAAKAHNDALRAQEAEAALARKRRDDAGAALSELRRALDRAAMVAQELGVAETRRAEAAARRGEAQAAVDQAMADARSAEDAERDARARLLRIEEAQHARTAASELVLLQERHAKAQAAREAIERGEADLAALALPDDGVDRLQRLDVEIAGLRAADEAGLPTLRIDYAPGIEPAILIDGAILGGGEERGVRDVARLEFAGVGTLTLRSNRPAVAGEALKTAEAKRQALLAKLGVADLGEAHRRQAGARSKAGEVEQLRQALRQLAPEGLPRLHEEIATRQAAATGVGLAAEAEGDGDPGALRTLLADAGQQVEAARNRVREAQPHLSRSVDALVECEKAVAGLRSQRDQLDAQLGPEALRTERLAALTTASDVAAAQAREQDEQVANLRSRAPDLETVSASRARAQSALAVAEQEEGRLREQLAHLTGLIRAKSDDAVEEAWQEAQEALVAAEARVKALETEVAVLDKLRNALQSSRSAARDLYLEPVLTELKPLLGLLFDDVSIVFDEKTLLPHSIRRNGQDEEVERLSGGMREQLSVMTRLAFARLLQRDGRTAPVILDDALVYSDDDRIERMFDALHRQSRSQQIIVFSCRQRAFAKLGGTVLGLVPWEPATV